MVHFAGLDVSVYATSVCVIDDTGKGVLEQRGPTDLADHRRSDLAWCVLRPDRIDAGPLSSGWSMG